MKNAESRTVLVANPSPDVYGSDLQMLESVSALVDRGWRVVVALPRDGQLVSRLRERRAEVMFVEFPVLRRANASAAAFVTLLVKAATSIPRILVAMRRIRPSVVYVNTVTLPWWLLAGRLARVPTLCHLHEAEKEDGRLVRSALIAPLRLADAVIVISRSTLEAMAEVVPVLRQKAHLIYNGVPAPSVPPKPAARRAPFRLLVVGRLSPRKAPHVALEATAQLRSAGVEVELEFAGSAFEGYEWYVDQLEERAAQPDLFGAVRFSGYRSPVWPTLAQADIVLAPSLREPFGNAVVEAQLALRPVVAAAALGHLESITQDETGLLVPPEDPTAMARAARELIEDGDLATRIATKARDAALARFGVERYSREVADLLESLTREGLRGRPGRGLDAPSRRLLGLLPPGGHSALRLGDHVL